MQHKINLSSTVITVIPSKQQSQICHITRLTNLISLLGCSPTQNLPRRPKGYNILCFWTFKNFPVLKVYSRCKTWYFNGFCNIQIPLFPYVMGTHEYSQISSGIFNHWPNAKIWTILDLVAIIMLNLLIPNISWYIDNKSEIEWKHKCRSSYWYSINGHGVVIIYLAPGSYTNLNSTYDSIKMSCWKHSLYVNLYVHEWLWCWVTTVQNEITVQNKVHPIINDSSAILIIMSMVELKWQ